MRRDFALGGLPSSRQSNPGLQHQPVHCPGLQFILKSIRAVGGTTVGRLLRVQDTRLHRALGTLPFRSCELPRLGESQGRVKEPWASFPAPNVPVRSPVSSTGVVPFTWRQTDNAMSAKPSNDGAHPAELPALVPCSGVSRPMNHIRACLFQRALCQAKPSSESPIGCHLMDVRSLATLLAA